MGFATLNLSSCKNSNWGASSLNHSNTTLAIVNGNKITEEELDFIAEVGPPQMKTRLATPSGKKRLLEEIVDRELLYAEAIRRRLNRDPQLQKEIHLHERVLIANAAIKDAVNKMAKEYYEERSEEFTTLTIQHILIKFGKGSRTENEAVALANEIRKKSEAGVDFIMLAKQYSEDATSNTHGGSLGEVWAKEPRLMRRGYEPLLAKAFSLTEPGVVGPVKSKDGYHIIFVKKLAKIRPYSEVEEKLLFKLRQDAAQDLLKKLREKAKIKILLSDPKSEHPDHTEHHDHTH